jgi:hypothetical protein
MSDVLGLVRYDAMVLAIKACHSVDEVKEIRDKARAIEVYAAQALNRDAERKAAEIRIRAERKTGELLKATKESGERHSGRGDQKSGSRHPTPILADLGISKDQSSQWQKLAAIPEEKFNEVLANPYVIPSTDGVLEAMEPPFKMEPIRYDTDALLAHGRIMNFQEMMQRPAKELFDLMADYQKREVVAIIPTIVTWLQEMKDEEK